MFYFLLWLRAKTPSARDAIIFVALKALKNEILAVTKRNILPRLLVTSESLGANQVSISVSFRVCCQLPNILVFVHVLAVTSTLWLRQ